MRLLVAVAAVTIAIALVEAGAQYASDLWLQAAGERITHDLRTRVYEHLQRLSLGFHQQRQKGDLVTRVTGDVNAMGDLFSQSLGAMVEAALLAVGMTVVLAVIDPVLAVVAIATAPLTGVLSFVYRRRVRTQSRVRRAQEGEIASIANEALSAMAVVKAFGSEGYESERVREGSARRLASGVEVARLQARFDGLVGSVRAISTALVLVVGAIRVSHGAISPGELLVFASYTRKAQSPMRDFAREMTKVAAAMAKGDRIAELLEADDVLPEPPGRLPRRARGGRRRARARLVRLRRGAAGAARRLAPRPAGRADRADGAVGRRQVDARRAGRALLRPRRGPRADRRPRRARLLAGVAARPGRGRAPGHRAVQRHRPRQHRLRDRRDPRAGRGRRRARPPPHDFIRGLPEGYDTDLGPQGVALSGGQRQRIGIARTLLRNPPVLVLDEPTTGLDAVAETAVLDGLKALMDGRTTILITHSQRLADTADRVVGCGWPGRDAARGSATRCRSSSCSTRTSSAR